MFKKFADWLIQRRKKQLHIPVVVGSTSPEDEFRRVLNALRENKVMVKIMEDGIYIRMAGDVNKGECFSLEWVKVKS